ncbi:hypothetical protein EDC94DRAFT_590931 [Helicostylum pulchrum]|nr:hypothetical protein EDC94DRAFT_590931 [Helicostylum pulchrum]
MRIKSYSENRKFGACDMSGGQPQILFGKEVGEGHLPKQLLIIDVYGDILLLSNSLFSCSLNSLFFLCMFEKFAQRGLQLGKMMSLYRQNDREIHLRSLLHFQEFGIDLCFQTERQCFKTANDGIELVFSEFLAKIFTEEKLYLFIYISVLEVSGYFLEDSTEFIRKDFVDGPTSVVFVIGYIFRYFMSLGENDTCGFSKMWINRKCSFFHNTFFLNKGINIVINGHRRNFSIIFINISLLSIQMKKLPNLHMLLEYRILRLSYPAQEKWGACNKKSELDVF